MYFSISTRFADRTTKRLKVPCETALFLQSTVDLTWPQSERRKFPATSHDEVSAIFQRGVNGKDQVTIEVQLSSAETQ